MKTEFLKYTLGMTLRPFEFRFVAQISNTFIVFSFLFSISKFFKILLLIKTVFFATRYLCLPLSVNIYPLF